MSVSVDVEAVRLNLARAWDANEATLAHVPASMKAAIDGVMSASDVTFKYILVTAYVSKLTNPSIHARALQTGSRLRHSYDARSVCHKAVVPFEKSKGNLFGLSNEPFVNKPARHPEHHQDNDQLRNKVGARVLHTALEAAQHATPQQVFAGLAYLLSRGKARAEAEEHAEVIQAVTMRRVLTFCRQFMEQSDGGARLVAVWGAFTSLLAEDAEVSVESPNTSDQFAQTVGDIEVCYDGTVVSASECKQRPLNSDDVSHGLRKASRAKVSEYLFVISAGIARGQEEAVESILTQAATTLDTGLVDIHQELPWLVRALNPRRRGQFGETVVKLCRKMRKFQSADAAAALWNQITH